MKKYIFALSLILILVLSGCKDISGTYKPGSFGNTPEESKALDYFKAKYGDITQKGEPRFLEPLMSSEIVNGIPKTVATSYSKEAEKFYFWFVYDNFNEGDPIKVTWKYLENDYAIHTFEAKAGGDFGRGTFILEKPDTGWLPGTFSVIVSGRGIQGGLNFFVNNEPTKTAKLTWEKPGQSATTTTTTPKPTATTPAITTPIIQPTPVTTTTPSTPATTPGATTPATTPTTPVTTPTTPATPTTTELTDKEKQERCFKNHAYDLNVADKRASLKNSRETKYFPNVGMSDSCDVDFKLCQKAAMDAWDSCAKPYGNARDAAQYCDPAWIDANIACSGAEIDCNERYMLHLCTLPEYQRGWLGEPDH